MKALRDPQRTRGATTRLPVSHAKQGSRNMTGEGRRKSMKLIETFREGDRIGDVYLCKSRQMATAKNGKNYENVTLQDKSGLIDCKIWDPASTGIDEFEALDYVYIVGDVTSFQGNLQLNIKRARKAKEGEYDAVDYLPVSTRDPETMYEELTELLASVENPWLRQLIDKYFGEASFREAFIEHSAAKTVHHSFVGGLLEHTLSVVKLCDYYCRQYPYLNHDLLLTAAAFHDVGKLKEISNFPSNDYTDDGQLLGHIVMGSELIGYACRTIKGFPHKLCTELQHCILAHHGMLEYGSPKKPALPEALALHLADNTDARLETMKELMDGAKKNPNPGAWLGYNKLFESNIRESGQW